MNKPEYIIVHHSASPRDTTTVQMVNGWHKDRGFPISSLGLYVGYHVLITMDGMAHQARQYNEEGAHAKTADGMNFKSVGICLAGNFENEVPTGPQLAKLQEYIEAVRKQFNIPIDKVLFHGQVSKTACCGKNLITWLESYKRRGSETSNPMKHIKAFVICPPNNADRIKAVFATADQKFREFSEGQFGIDLLGMIQKPLFVPDAMTLSDDRLRAELNGIDIPDATQWLLIFYENTMVRPWASTQYIAGTPDIPITKFGLVPDVLNGVLFEGKHASVQFYNANRDRATMPAISNMDEYNGPVEYIAKQIKELMPYLQVFDKTPLASAQDNMIKLLKVKGDPKVWLITNGIRFWILDPATRDSFGVEVEEGDHEALRKPLKQYKYGGAIGAFHTDDPLE